MHLAHTGTETPLHLADGHVWSILGHRWESLEQVIQNSTNDHRWSTDGKLLTIDGQILATGGYLKSSKWQIGIWHIQMLEKKENHMKFSWKFCYTTFRKAIQQSKVPNFSNMEEKDTGIISNQTTRQFETKIILQEQRTSKSRLWKISENVVMPLSRNQFVITTPTQKFERLDPYVVTLV